MRTVHEPSSDHESDPEEILNSSLQTLYDYQPITLSSPNSLFTYTSPRNESIIVKTPDTLASNWALHASSIWKSSLYIADHLDDLDLPDQPRKTPLQLLELGAGAGLPGILIAKTHPHIFVTVSDYPDDQLIGTLSENISRNKVQRNCVAKAYAWGTDIQSLAQGSESSGLFDVIIAADTLWNPDSHKVFIDSLGMLLKRSDEARVHLVAGLHTGRYTLHSFLQAVQGAGFILHSAEERESSGSIRRPWNVCEADNEDERDRRRWVLWIVLRWPNTIDSDSKVK